MFKTEMTAHELVHSSKWAAMIFGKYEEDGFTAKTELVYFTEPDNSATSLIKRCVELGMHLVSVIGCNPGELTRSVGCKTEDMTLEDNARRKFLMGMALQKVKGIPAA